MVTVRPPPPSRALSAGCLDDGGIVQQIFQFLDAPFQKALVFFGFVIIGIFRKIAHLDGRAQAQGQLIALRAFQLGQFDL